MTAIFILCTILIVLGAFLSVYAASHQTPYEFTFGIALMVCGTIMQAASLIVLYIGGK